MKQKNMKTFFKTVLIASCVSLLLFSCTKEDDSVIDTNNKKTPATSAQFYKKSFSLAMGGREKVMLVTQPENSEITGAHWSSSDTTVAKVDSLGIIKAIKAGEATIYLTANNNISGECAVSIIESPITGLVMPEAQFPIAKGALMFIQGTGFTKNSKIILRHHTDFKSTNSDDDILAQINELALSYINLWITANSGSYNVVLNENGKEFDLGNIEIETPNIPSYSYDKNKIFWDDNHWRWFQLRGKVKKMITTEYYSLKSHSLNLPDFVMTYSFNNKGYLESYCHGENETTVANYKYDNQNRLIQKSENMLVISSCKNCIVQSTCNYIYGDHKLYIPLGYDSETKFLPFYYNPFPFLSYSEFENIYNIEMYQKGLIGINCIKTTTFGTETQNYTYHIESNKAILYLEDYFPSSGTDVTYTWKFKGQFPYEEIYEQNDPNDIVSKSISYQPNGIPDSVSTIYNYYNNYSDLSIFEENCPFYLYSTYQFKYLGTNLKYDKNWNLTYSSSFTLPSEEINISDEFFYSSYDKEGNWTECYVEEKESNGNSYIRHLIRQITYW